MCHHNIGGLHACLGQAAVHALECEAHRPFVGAGRDVRAGESKFRCAHISAARDRFALRRGGSGCALRLHHVDGGAGEAQCDCAGGRKVADVARHRYRRPKRVWIRGRHEAQSIRIHGSFGLGNRFEHHLRSFERQRSGLNHAHRRQRHFFFSENLARDLRHAAHIAAACDKSPDVHDRRAAGHFENRFQRVARLLSKQAFRGKRGNVKYEPAGLADRDQRRVFRKIENLGRVVRVLLSACENQRSDHEAQQRDSPISHQDSFYPADRFAPAISGRTASSQAVNW